MNERIKELAEQAGADFMRRINYNNLEGKEYEEDAGIIFESNESFEKFAELIVRECAGIYDKIDNGNLHMGTDNYLEALRKHFGVEQ